MFNGGWIMSKFPDTQTSSTGYYGKMRTLLWLYLHSCDPKRSEKLWADIQDTHWLQGVFDRDVFSKVVTNV